LSLQLLLDEDSQDKILIKLLRTAGYDVLTINEANISGGKYIFYQTQCNLELAVSSTLILRKHKQLLARM
jgi:hypothetical protein